MLEGHILQSLMLLLVPILRILLFEGILMLGVPQGVFEEGSSVPVEVCRFVQRQFESSILIELKSLRLAHDGGTPSCAGLITDSDVIIFAQVHFEFNVSNRFQWRRPNPMQLHAYSCLRKNFCC